MAENVDKLCRLTSWDLVAQTAWAASIWSHRTAGLHRREAPLSLRQQQTFFWDPPLPHSRQLQPPAKQANHCHSRASSAKKKQKNPLTVCAARYRTNYGGNGGMYAKTSEKPLKNSQNYTNESVTNLNVKEACRTAKLCNAKGVAPKVSMLWHFSSSVHACRCLSSMLWSIRPHRSTRATPWGPEVKAKIWT